MANYTFQTNLLSAAKTGFPPLVGTSLSATGVSFLSGAGVVFASQQVGIVSLSTDDVGIAFNPVSVSVANASLPTFTLNSFPMKTVTVAGSIFNIPSRLDSSNFAIVKTSPGDFTVFPWLSTTTTIPTSALSADRQVTTQDTRRKRLLGY
jgi:hypothetical protein